MDIQGLVGQVLAQAASVVVIVAMLRMALRRFIGNDPSAGALLALNILANAAITIALLLQSGSDFGDLHTYGALALVTLLATIVAHGGYDLVATRAKGNNGGGGVPPVELPLPGSPPVAADYPPGAETLADLGLPTEPDPVPATA